MESDLPADAPVGDTLPDPGVIDPVPPPQKSAYQMKLMSLERAISRQDTEIEELSNELKVAKAQREGLIGDLRKAVRDADQPDIPFKESELESVDDWKDVPLADVLKAHVSEKIIEKLTEAELTTVGQLAEYTAKCRLTDIKGIGQAKAEQIEKAMEHFWATRPQKGGEADAPHEEQAATEPAVAHEPDGETLAQLDGGD